MNKKIHWEKIDKQTFTNEFQLRNEAEEKDLGEDEDNDLKRLLMNGSDNEIDHTLFGSFHKNSLDNPHNLYNYDFMYLAHMVGFNANSPNFYTYVNNLKHRVVDLVEGVAVWRVVDTHKFVIIPAKYYDAKEVTDAIDKALYGESNHSHDNQDGIYNDDLLDECIDLSENYGDKKHTIILMPDSKIKHLDESATDYDVFVKNAKQIYSEFGDDVFVIIDGIIYEENNDTKKDSPFE